MDANLDAITLNAKQVDVRSRTEKTILQILAEPIVDGEGDDKRRYSSGNSGDRNASNDANDGLPPLGAEIARSNKNSKRMGLSYCL